jgi:adenylate kinase
MSNRYDTSQQTKMTGTTPSARRYPNILVTGTPGTGKTTVAEAIVAALQQQQRFQHVDSKSIIEQYHCTDGHDDQLHTDFLDEDKFLDALETIFDDNDDDDDNTDTDNNHHTEGGIVLDFHIPEIFPQRWFDLVLVCRTTTDVLFDRLTARRYDTIKRDNNVQAEIMHVIHEAAVDAYEPHLVHAVDNNTLDDLTAIVARVQTWVAQWQRDRQATAC